MSAPKRRKDDQKEKEDKDSSKLKIFAFKVGKMNCVIFGSL